MRNDCARARSLPQCSKKAKRVYQKSDKIQASIIDVLIRIHKTKCLKPKFFCCLNEILMTFLYTLIGATRKQKEKKKFYFLMCVQKSNVIKKSLGFSI